MSADKRLHAAFAHAPVLPLTPSSRYILFSDCHRGCGTHNDNFLKNQNLYFAALEYYYNHGYTYIELGDGDELWENRSFDAIKSIHNNAFWLLSRFHKEGRLFMLYGNHDIVKRNARFTEKRCASFPCSICQEAELFPGIVFYPGIILKNTTCTDYSALLRRASAHTLADQENCSCPHPASAHTPARREICPTHGQEHCSHLPSVPASAGREIYLTHGHQADFFNSVLWRTSRFLVRYVWKPLESIGFLDPTSAAKNNIRKKKVERTLSAWADKNACVLITGHTHRPMLDESLSYCNTGSCVHPRCVTCIEISRLRITLVKWTLATRPDRSLYVARKVLSGPFPLEG